jgi:PAS domain S-box-containing protein
LALEKQRNLLTTLMDHLPYAIYFKDLDSRFIAVNRNLTHLFGKTDPAELIGKTDRDFFSTEHAEGALADEREIMRTGIPIVDYEEKETWPDKADREKAAVEWQQHFNVLSKAETATMTPRAALPDLVFTANGGLVLGRDVILGHFLHRERRPEEPWFREWFEQNGFNVRELPHDLPFEGEGDALWDGAPGILWAAYGIWPRRRTLWTIRRCGGIAAAVEQGVVRGGIFYECVKKGVPFALAGSIRDDGPLLETEMD